MTYSITEGAKAACLEQGIDLRKHPRPARIKAAKKVKSPPQNTGMFFSIYFAMTGLHGIHVIAGILVFGWLLWRVMKGHFTPEYFSPIERSIGTSST